ncbi:MAG: winged helix-turn-helix transcriptional regulator, partial [Xanthomonadales bacterium]|nr:winged helix-turn-helix transcriptional regulator [Xanthomonadales bacterium]
MREPVFPCAIELPEAAGGRLTALHRQLRGAIVSGRLPAGFALPATRVAAMSLGVARNTVAKAYDLLVAEGYVRARRGARATVQDLGLRPGASGPGDPQPQRLLNPQWLQAADSFEPVGSP